MLESEDASGFSGVDGSEPELSSLDDEEDDDDDEPFSDDGSGALVGSSEEVADEFCEELVDGLLAVDELEEGFLTVAPAYQSFFSIPFASI